MIRFSASLVVIAVGLLVAGVVMSRLLLVYLAIAVSVVALIALAAGVFRRREELFGQPPPALPPDMGNGMAGTGLPPARGAWGEDPAAAGSFTEIRPTEVQPSWAAGRFPGAAERSPLAGYAGPSAGHADDAAAWRDDFAGRTTESGMRSGDTLVWSQGAPAARQDHAAAWREVTPERPPGPAAPEGAAPEGGTRDSAVPQTTVAPDPATSDAAPPDAGASGSVASQAAVGHTGKPETAAKTPAPDAAAPTPGAAAPGATAEAGAPAGQDVKVVPGVPRYHRGDCILIRFMGDDDLDTMSLEQAEQAGCTPCRACQPGD